MQQKENHLSDALTPDAHGDDTAATSVEDSAPVSDPSVESGSAGGDEAKTVSAERFNGLMSSHQRTLDEMRAMKEKLDALQAERTQQQETNDNVSDDTTREELAALRQELAAERLDRARREVLDEFPDAKPFGDLIVANTVDEMRDLARELASRVQAVKGTTTSESTTDTTDASGTDDTDATTAEDAGTETDDAGNTPVVTGGATSFDEDATLTDAVNDAIQKGDFYGFLQAKVATATRAGENTELA